MDIFASSNGLRGPSSVRYAIYLIEDPDFHLFLSDKPSMRNGRVIFNKQETLVQDSLSVQKVGKMEKIS